MNAVGERPGLRAAVAGLALAALVTGTAACGGGSDSSDGGGGATTAAPGPTSTTTAASSSSSTTAATTATSATSGQATTTTSAGLPDASEAQHSAPSDGTGTALLRAVRVGRNEGFERIVFEFEGTSMPGYRVQWVDGPILADGSGETVEVAGDAYLEMVMDPASGVDLSAPQLTIVYDGPDRIAVADQTELITDLVRTGDFESVLTWVAGTTEKVPFRVLRLSEPTRVVVDLEAP
jgi:hypothetical protein